ncbi:MAG TPA: RluA family pseudouridine synthase [Candidatus Paceibacterota bacterium]|nr:RluA family pseudouridine synthase [Candidatus Paceibacterota bacterium]
MQSASAGMGNSEPRVLYEDADVLVLAKPSGLIVHGDGRSTEPTLADWLIARDPSITEVGEPWTAPSGAVIPRPGIVHRLDRETSGVMIVAKNDRAFAHLKQQFKERLAKKTYDVLAYGHPKEDGGLIDKPIGRSPRDFRRWSAQPGARGELRNAQTRWRVLARGRDEKGEAIAHLEAEPLTGRTHQIRVHLKAIHHPVVCDALYAPNRPCCFGIGRVALHARRLAITLPSGEERVFEAPVPQDLEAAFAALGAA